MELSILLAHSWDGRFVTGLKIQPAFVGGSTFHGLISG
jgi:hypothetical protein